MSIYTHTPHSRKFTTYNILHDICSEVKRTEEIILLIMDEVILKKKKVKDVDQYQKLMLERK